jgi:hypothetical protein
MFTVMGLRLVTEGTTEALHGHDCQKPDLVSGSGDQVENALAAGTSLTLRSI